MMFKKGLAIIVILLFLGLAVSPSIYADNKMSLETTTEYDYDGYTPIQLVFLLINKLRYYEGIESEEDVLQIIESDAEVSGIVEELKSFDCGCEDDYKPELFERRWWIVCIFLFPIWLFTVLISVTHGGDAWERIVFAISEVFNCGFE